ncbi:MAG: hypothetical protein Q8Q31_04280 [Nanoarchaeota archaeon]|nr:hypothetical protein [Nanoarchaeota archaeon]
MRAHIRREDFEKAYEDLGDKNKKELSEIQKELALAVEKNEGSSKLIKDKAIKKRIARICLRLAEETPKQEISIMETSYIITGNFVYYNYDDPLDEIIDVFSELELPVEQLSWDIFKLWDVAISRLKRYLRK